MFRASLRTPRKSPSAILAICTLAWVATPAEGQSRLEEDYVILTRQTIHIAAGANVQGSIAVSDPRGRAKVGPESVMASGTAVVSDRVSLGRGSKTFDVYANRVNFRPGSSTIAGSLNSPIAPPIYAPEPLVLPDPFDPANYPSDFPVTCGATDREVIPGQTIVVAPGDYDEFDVRPDGKILLQPGTYNVCRLNVLGHLEATGPVTINVRDRFMLGRGATLVPTAGFTSADLQVNVEGRRAVKFGRNSTYTARLFAPLSNMKIGSGAVVTGHIVARRLGCSSKFTIIAGAAVAPICGNGTLDAGETCDPPNSPQPPNQNLCTADCTFCGDGLTQAGEQCDDGNSNNGDACSNSCTTNPPPSCGNGSLDPGESCDPPGSDPPPAGGNLCRTNCTYCGDATVDPSEECDDGNTDPGDGCRNDCTLPPPPSCGNGNLEAGETCDPPGSDPPPAGGNLCRLGCTYCGDGIADPGEQCDDGNLIDGDACRNDCTLPAPPTCGNGSLDSGETCDPPGSDPAPPGGNLCRVNCTYCGDSLVQAGEACDDGNTDDTDACRNDCTLNQPPACGNGSLDAGETCDPPGSDPFPPGGNLCRTTCNYCGDGIVNDGESCDDGNTDDNDACRNNCTVNTAPTCGDGSLNQPGETCDPPGSDPPPAGGELCRSDCTYCGDGVVDGAEECDDANTNDGDACRNDCTLPGPGPCVVDVEKAGSPDQVPVGNQGPNCNGKVTAITLRYTGEGCGATTNPQEGKVSCFGGAAFAEPVRIVIFKENDSNTEYGDVAGVLVGGTAGATAANAGDDKFASSTEVEIHDGGGSVIENVVFHTSCSKPLNLGDKFGSLEVVSLTTTESGEQNLGDDVVYTYTIENLGSETLTTVDVVDDQLGVVPGSPVTNLAPGATAVIQATALISQETTNVVVVDATASGGATCEDTDSFTVTTFVPPPPPATCEDGKPISLTFRYTGEGCSAGNNPQGGSATCTGGANFAAPVRILIRDKNDGTIVYGDTVGVPLQGTATGTAANGGENRFKSNTMVRIFNASGAIIEENIIHTSCSKPLGVGDQFGSLELIEFIPEP